MPEVHDSCYAGTRATPGLARQRVRELLSTALAPADLEDLLMLLSELTSNAVLHAGGQVRVRVLADDRLVRLEVSDSSSRTPIGRRTPRGTEVSGRGVALIEVLSRAWGVERTAQGKRVWCELALTAPVASHRVRAAATSAAPAAHPS